MAQKIVIPGFRKVEVTQAGGEPATDYDTLANKPLINNVPLTGSMVTTDLHLTDSSLTQELVPAEAKAVGEKLALLNATINDLKSALTQLNSTIGQLTDLATTDKTSIVAAINELNTRVFDLEFPGE